MIDIHSHIAWGIDDGMPNQEDAKKAFELARKSGMTIICSTPHFVPGQLNKENLKEIRMRQREARELASQYGIKLAFGAEMFMNTSFPGCLNNGFYATLNESRYLLCEFDVRKDIHQIENYNDYLYEITVRKLIPCIAHVERYFSEGLDFKILDSWRKEGYVFQVNRTSLQGLHGKQIQKNAWELVDKGYAHAVATDCHRCEGSRVEVLNDIYEEIRKKYGEEYAKLLCIYNPFYILSNKDVIEIKPQKTVFWRR